MFFFFIISKQSTNPATSWNDRNPRQTETGSHKQTDTRTKKNKIVQIKTACQPLQCNLYLYSCNKSVVCVTYKSKVIINTEFPKKTE